MSRQKRGLHLPHALQKELGVEINNRRRNNGVQNRREQRTTHRVEKRQHTRGNKSHNPTRNLSRQIDVEADEEEYDEFDEEASSDHNEPAVPVSAPTKSTLAKPSTKPSSATLSDSDLDDISDEDGLEEEEEHYERLYRGSTPEIVLDSGSRSYKDRQAEDDADIAALEKRLGMKSKKRKGNDEDGLADILGGLDDEVEGDTQRRKREAEDWLRAKRQKTAASRHAVNDNNNNDAEEGLDASEDEDSNDDDDVGGTDLDEDGFSGFESGSDDAQLMEQNKAATKRTRENPYIPPVTTAPTGKYIPPSLRKSQSQPDEAMLRLRRQLQGHLNKLSEANLISIVSEIETLYRNNPRGDVTSILIDLLLNLFTSPSTLSNTFIILHAAFATATYRTIGVDFGAQLLSSLIDRFFEYHQNTTTANTTPKEPLNLLSLLANLFTFSLVASPMITSLIARLLDPLTEANTELLLRLIRDCGPQLRSTDPGALKTIAARTSAAVNALQAKGETVTVRTKFMLETITDLKNNKSRESTANAGASREHITRMRKALGTLSTRNLRATEPLRIDLSDILNSDRKGKWWLVGASWKGHDAASRPDAANASNHESSFEMDMLDPVIESTEVSIPDLARSLRLTTPLQQLILSAIATSPSANIAHEHVLKLGLKNAQIPEIPRVVLRCSAAEPGWNEFYAQLSNRLCVLGDKAGKIRKGWEFATWAYLRSIGASGDDDDDPDAAGGMVDDDDDEDSRTTSLNAVNNTARLLASLIQAGHVSLGVLRTVELHLLREDSKAQLWVEMLLVRVLILCRGEDVSVGRVFRRLEATPQVVPRLRVFLKRWVRRSELTADEAEKSYVKKGCKVAERVLEELGRNK